MKIGWQRYNLFLREGSFTNHPAYGVITLETPMVLKRYYPIKNQHGITVDYKYFSDNTIEPEEGQLVTSGLVFGLELSYNFLLTSSE